MGQLVYDKPIKRWDEGLPLGNGETGLLIYGSSKTLTFALDRCDVWDTSRSIEEGENFNAQYLKKCLHDRDMIEMKRVFDTPYDLTVPTKLPIGKLIFDFGLSYQAHFDLDIFRAEATVKLKRSEIKSFVHSDGRVTMLKITGKTPKIRLVRPNFGKKTWKDKLNFGSNPGGEKISALPYPPADRGQIVQDGIRGEYFVQKIDSDTYYGVFYAAKKTGDGIELAVFSGSVRPSEVIPTGFPNVEKLKEECIALITGALHRGYEPMMDAHLKEWAHYYSLSNICLPDKYIESRYNMTKYLFHSCSRRGQYPMPLQGVWTACDDVHLPPWKGDYHHDLNTQMSYYAYLKANDIDGGLSFVDYLHRLTDIAKEFAKNYYNTDGICLPSVMDIRGKAMGGWPMYSMSPTNPLWLAQTIERHYTYTMDREFLEKTAYPYIKGSADFIISLLKEDENGRLVLPFSSSPEIHDNRIEAFLLPNSNYDQTLIVYIIKTVIRFSKLLLIPADRYEAILAKLHPLAIDGDGVLMLSRNERLIESHRHFAHAMAIHPIRLLDYKDETDKRVIDATIKDLEKLGTDFWTGYSYTWLAELYAIQKNGDKARDTVKIFFEYFCSPNLFHLNGDYKNKGYSKFHYRPFTLEGNFCAQDAIQEMLLYSENGEIELFPAIPKDWEEVSFSHLRACGAVLVSATLTKHQIAAEFFALSDTAFVLLNNNKSYQLNKGESVRIESSTKPNQKN